MKKIALSIIFIFICFASYGHIGHYTNYKKIEMEILRNNELIGYNYYFFSQKDDVTVVTNQFKFDVKFLGATIFKVEGIGEETYLKDQLISFNSKTLQNKKEKFVKLTLNKKKKNLILWALLSLVKLHLKMLLVIGGVTKFYRLVAK